MGYKILACDGTPDAAYVGKRPAEFEGTMWMLGIQLQLPSGPFTFELDPNRGRNLAAMYTVGALLMREDLLRTIQSAGVGNLQVLPAAIEDPRTGERHADYRLVNIIGKLAAVDEEKSERLDTAAGHMIDSLFSRLELDESRARGFLMFRLAEAVHTVVVHDSVVAAIRAGNFQGMTFYSPAHWV